MSNTSKNPTTQAGLTPLTWWIIGGAVLVLIGFIVLGRFGSSVSPTKIVTDPSSLPGIQTSDAPWLAEFTYLSKRLQADNLPALASEGTVLHIHQHIDIYVHGQPVAVPRGIGIDPQSRFISPIHVHDTTGVIHVESPTVQTFTLGQFFDVWGVRFTAQCMGSYCTQSDTNLQVYTNGTLYQGDPRQLALSAHQEIAVVYGTSKEVPSNIPSSYSFPQGE